MAAGTLTAILHVMAAGTLTVLHVMAAGTLTAVLHVMAAGALTAVHYRDEILDPIVRPFAGAIGNKFILMQDNPCPHTAVLTVMEYIDHEGTEVMD